jgi:hypothetical protein
MPTDLGVPSERKRKAVQLKRGPIYDPLRLSYLRASHHASLDDLVLRPLPPNSKAASHARTGGLAFPPYDASFGANTVWGGRTGVQAKRPDPTHKSYTRAQSPRYGSRVASYNPQRP